MMDIFRKVRCKLCEKKTPKTKSFELRMKTAEGPHKIIICEDCAKALEEVKGEINGIFESRDF